MPSSLEILAIRVQESGLGDANGVTRWFAGEVLSEEEIASIIEAEILDTDGQDTQDNEGVQGGNNGTAFSVEPVPGYRPVRQGL